MWLFLCGMEISMIADEKFLTVNEVSKLLRVGIWTLRLWRRKGVGPDFVAIEGSILYPESAIRSYLKTKYRGTPTRGYSHG